MSRPPGLNSMATSARKTKNVFTYLDQIDRNLEEGLKQLEKLELKFRHVSTYNDASLESVRRKPMNIKRIGNNATKLTSSIPSKNASLTITTAKTKNATKLTSSDPSDNSKNVYDSKNDAFYKTESDLILTRMSKEGQDRFKQLCTKKMVIDTFTDAKKSTSSNIYTINYKLFDTTQNNTDFAKQMADNWNAIIQNNSVKFIRDKEHNPFAIAVLKYATYSTMLQSGFDDKNIERFMRYALYKTDGHIVYKDFTDVESTQESLFKTYGDDFVYEDAMLLLESEEPYKLKYEVDAVLTHAFENQERPILDGALEFVNTNKQYIEYHKTNSNDFTNAVARLIPVLFKEDNLDTIKLLYGDAGNESFLYSETHKKENLLEYLKFLNGGDENLQEFAKEILKKPEKVIKELFESPVETSQSTGVHEQGIPEGTTAVTDEKVLPDGVESKPQALDDPEVEKDTTPVPAHETDVSNEKVFRMAVPEADLRIQRGDDQLNNFSLKYKGWHNERVLYIYSTKVGNKDIYIGKRDKRNKDTQAYYWTNINPKLEKTTEYKWIGAKTFPKEFTFTDIFSLQNE